MRLGYTLAAFNSSLGFEVSPTLLGEWVEVGKGSSGYAGDLDRNWEKRQPLPHLPIPKESLLQAPTCVSMEMRHWACTLALGVFIPGRLWLLFRQSQDPVNLPEAIISGTELGVK